MKAKVKVTNPDKVFWPKEGYTKGDVIDYYHAISKYILPYIQNRPQSLNRHPNGIKGENFFQKNVKGLAPKWAKTYHNYFVATDEASLIYMVQLGCIEINPWFSRLGHLDKPDYLVLDLDPLEIDFKRVVEAAQTIRQILSKAGVKSYCKTSGATGLHVYVSLGAKYTYEQAKHFANIVAILTNKRLPKTTSVLRMPHKRRRKVYLDFLQNRKGQTLACPYSLRPKPGATVATPLKWSEVKPGLNPKKFTIKTIFPRLKKHGDLFKPVLGKGIDLKKALKLL
ncbi:MAG: DNA polymerase LigD [Candidatus Doudnabacteria bacterium]|nr:DNA polymerase LigD [Candidatus Doudnabacteria bacterium]